MCTGIKSTTSVDIDEQVVNNVVASFVENLFIVGSTTLFTPVNITPEQVVDFLNFYVYTTVVLFITDSENITFERLS
jgi:hypothetical protein